VVASFAYFSWQNDLYGHFIKKTSPASTAGATLLVDRSKLDMRCGLDGCPIDGDAMHGSNGYYYLPIGGNGARYRFVVEGADLETVGVAAGFNQPNPNQISEPQMKDQLIIDYVGSCEPINAFISVIGNSTFDLNLRTSTLEQQTYCNINWGYLICYIIIAAGGIAWIILLLTWFTYSCVIREHNSLYPKGGYDTL